MTPLFARLLLASWFAVMTPAGVRAAEPGPLQRLVFATDWKAEAEQGGFYEAQALGLYKAQGLDVVIRQGGAAVNVPQLLAAGAVDLGIGSNSFIPLNLLQAGAQVKAVMASFQKDPQVLIAHPRDDIRSIADMKGKPVMISDASIGTIWAWLKARYGFRDTDIRKYTNNLAPFLVDPQAITQGYVTSEPYTIEQALGRPPKVFLLADAGYPGYSSLVLVPQRLIAERPAAVRSFVAASIEGWRRYVTGDPAPGNALIRANNPEMTDALLAQAIAKLKQYGLVDGGDAKTGGVEIMTDARWKSFFESVAGQNLYPASMPYKDAYTLDFLPKPGAKP